MRVAWNWKNRSTARSAAHDLTADRLAQRRRRKRKIVPALEPVVDHGRSLALAVEQKAGFPAAEILVEVDEKVAQREVENARHDEYRRIQRHAGAIVDRRQACQDIANGLRVSLRIIPRNIGGRAQHGIEHDRARRPGSAVAAADRSVIVGDEGNCGRRLPRILRRVVGWRGDDAVKNQPVLVEQARIG
jgi:hypothetical protein